MEPIRKVERAARINLTQRVQLIQMLEDYFMETLGRCSNIEDPEIPFAYWEIIADSLKYLGPSKAAAEWKKCFMFIKLRTKTKLKNGADFDYLLETEQKIVNMFGRNWNTQEHQEPYEDEISEEQGHQEPYEDETSEEQGHQESCEPDCTNHNFHEGHTLTGMPCNYNNSDDSIEYIDERFDDNQSMELARGNTGTRRGVITHKSTCQCTCQCTGEANRGAARGGATRGTTCGGTTHGGARGEATCGRATRGAARGRATRGAARGGATRRAARGGATRRAARRAARGGATRRAARGGAARGGATRGAAGGGTTHDLDATPQTSEGKFKVNNTQKDRLLVLVKANFLRVVGRYTTADGVNYQNKIWIRFADELNQLGPARTDKEWKTMFNFIKATSKAKFSAIRQGLKTASDLSDHDKMIKSMFGIELLDGCQELGEGGLGYDKTLPFRNITSTVSATIPATNNTSAEERITTDDTNMSEQSNTQLDSRNDSCTEQRVGEHQLREENETCIECELCGSFNGIIICWLCDNKILCETCDDMFHRHPLRKTHKRKTLRVKNPETSTIVQPSVMAVPSTVTSTIVRPSVSISTPISAVPTHSILTGNTVTSHNVVGGEQTRTATSALTEQQNRIGTCECASQPPHRPIQVSSTEIARVSIFETPQNSRNSSRLRNSVQSREGPHYQNRTTTYDMVQNSLSMQFRSISQTENNHAEMLFQNQNNHDELIRQNANNHSEMIQLYTNTISSFTQVIRDVYNVNNNVNNN